MSAFHALEALPAPLRRLTERIGALAGRNRLRVALVGGAVRDLLFGTPLAPDAELDVLVEGDGPAFAGLLALDLHGTLRKHAAFLTARVDWISPDGTPQHMDVATARTERYLAAGALPLVSPALLEQDLARRDFTINAMAIRLDPPYAGQLLDPFGGQKDLADRRLRVLHDRSFEDDPTRMFRAARFAARYNLTLDAGTFAQLVRALPALRRVSGTRIRHELALVAEERDPAASLVRLGVWGVFAAIHPALTPDATCLRLVGRMLSSAPPAPWQTAADPCLLVAYALLYGCPPDALPEAARRLGLSAPELRGVRKTLTALAGCTAELAAQLASPAPRLSALYALIASLPPEGLCLLAATAGESARNLMACALERGRSMPLSGGDVLALGVPSGIACGQILRCLCTAWIDGLAGDREALVALARRHAAALAAPAGAAQLRGLHPGRLPCTKKDTV